MSSLAFLLVLLVAAGAVCGITALLQLHKVKAELAALKRQLNQTAPIQRPVTMASLPQLEPTPPPALLTAAETPAAIAVHVPTQSTDWLSSVSGWIEQQLIKRGMVWLGALALALGGVFLVKHSLDSGWLSPVLRVSCGLIFGLLLLLGSEWLHQRSRGHALTNYAPAALSSGGFISQIGRAHV